MNQTNINQMLWLNLLTTSKVDDICTLIHATMSEHRIQDIVDMLETFIRVDIPTDKIIPIINTIEGEYIDGSDIDLAPYIALLYDKANIKYLAKYYLGLTEKVDDNIKELLSPLAKLYNDEAELKISASSISNYNFSTQYEYQGQTKEYSVHSFSQEIGKNATVLKLPYGAIMFDCGAACGIDKTDVITEIELLEFFMQIDISPDDLLAVLISHAHLDHYGSIATLLNVGIEMNKIYIEDDTKALIQQLASDIPSISEAMPVNAFFYPFQKVKLTAFPNGHILGSTGYIVTFDERNVVYTGDYCIHSQKTVAGLNLDKLLHQKVIADYGVDCLITETTYGNHCTPIEYKYASEVFLHFVDLLLEHGYKIFIPSFAIGRSQEIALLLNETHSILIDGLASKISRIYENISGIKIFNNNTRFNDCFGEDKETNFDVNDIVIASSGMLSQNSTSYNYVRELLTSDRKIAIIKTGYISSESYGNELLNQWIGNKFLLFDISLSAHADLNEIYSLISVLNPRNIVCIHGDGIKISLDQNIVNAKINTNNEPKEFVDKNLKEWNDNEHLKSIVDQINAESEQQLNSDEGNILFSSNGVYENMVQELMLEPKGMTVELINRFISAYIEASNVHKLNTPSFSNHKMYEAYWELYSYIRIYRRYDDFYQTLFELGSDKSKVFSYLQSLMREFQEKCVNVKTEQKDEEKSKVVSEVQEELEKVSLPEDIGVKEKPLWNETSILFVHKGTIICQRDNHNIVSTTAVLLGYSEEKVELTVNYCKDCRKFFINYVSYETYRKRYGILIGNIVLENDNRTIFSDVALAEASPLKLCGYSVNQQDGYSKETRQYIISKIIDKQIMSKSDVIRYLEYFISINGKRKGNQSAVLKWKEDLAFTLKYEANKQERHIITDIQRYRY